jgi:hypothetical protein
MNRTINIENEEKADEMQIAELWSRAGTARTAIGAGSRGA